MRTEICNSYNKDYFLNSKIHGLQQSKNTRTDRRNPRRSYVFCRNQRLMQSHNTDNTAPMENICRQQATIRWTDTCYRQTNRQAGLKHQLSYLRIAHRRNILHFLVIKHSLNGLVYNAMPNGKHSLFRKIFTYKINKAPCP